MRRPSSAASLGKLASVLAVASVLVAGCGGSASSSGPTNTTVREPSSDPYENLMHECELINEEQMLAVLGLKSRLQVFNGAVCRWNAMGGGDPMEVTFYWFETGTLDREKDTLDFLKYDSQWRDFDGQQGIVAHPSGDPSNCGTMANSQNKGIIGWWVQPLYRSGADACGAAVQLMLKALNTRV